jgi:hypothetical protein
MNLHREIRQMLVTMLLIGSGIVIGAFASLLLDRFLMRRWLNSYVQVLRNKLSNAEVYYNTEGLKASNFEATAIGALRSISHGLEQPKYFWRMVEEATTALDRELRSEFELKKVLQELKKCEAKIAVLSEHLSADNHLLLSAKHFMSSLAAFRSKAAFDYSGYHSATATLPNIVRLIGEMEILVRTTR